MSKEEENGVACTKMPSPQNGNGNVKNLKTKKEVTMAMKKKLIHSVPKTTIGLKCYSG